MYKRQLQSIEAGKGSGIALPELEGCEYSIDGENWQVSNEFNGLTPETEYTFYYRTAATEEKAASPASTGVTYQTLKAAESSEISSSGSSSGSSSSTPNPGAVYKRQVLNRMIA